MRMCVALVFTLCSLQLHLGVATGQICQPAGPGEGSSLPDFNPKEFTMDIEMATDVNPLVVQTMMYYSEPQNQIRLNLLSDKEKADMYFYFSDQEALVVGYNKGQGRGECYAINITDGDVSKISFLPGIKADAKKVHTPLGALRMAGSSGFGGDIIVKKMEQTEMRGMIVDKYESCQKVLRDDKETIVKVTHYFSNSSVWSHPLVQTVPIAIAVEGSGTGKGDNFKEMYNIFNVQLTVDQTMLETPPGVYCVREKASSWLPSLPDFIQFSGEAIDTNKGTVSYIEEVFSEVDKFAVMRVDPQDQSQSMNIVQDFSTGLCFLINKQYGSCEVSNITECNRNAPVPFNMVDHNGKIRQLTTKEFFYANSEYHHVGMRRVRGVPCDAYVTQTKLITNPNKIIVVEWYFVRGAQPPVPMKFRVWHDDNSVKSTDINIYDVDYKQVKIGVFNVKPCFPNRAFNHFRGILVNSDPTKPIDDMVHAKLFKTMTTKTLAREAGVIFWRVVDLQLFFSDDGVVEIEFEILDAPPYAGDMVGKLYQHVSLEQATNNLIEAIKQGLPLDLYNPVSQEQVGPLNIKNFEVL